MPDQETLKLQSQEAGYLLSHPLIKGAFTGIRDELVQAIEDAPLGDAKLQRELALSLQVLRAVKGRLERYVQDYNATTITVEEY